MMNLRSMILSLLVCVCLLPVAAFARNDSNGQAHADKTEAIQKEILRLEDLGRQKALKGDKEWDDLMADGAYLIGPDGTILVYQKGQNLSSMALTSFNLSELIVRVYGDVAVVTGLAEVASETAEKKPFSFKMRYLNVWKKSGDSWKIVVAERTMVRPLTK
ncbi:MAG TPA: nuclear transport factor 2 family protein [Pyrinomonadaceae bacterium]